MVGKSGQFGKVIAGKFNHLEGNFDFEIKKYIRNSGKSNYLAGKNKHFQAMHVNLQTDTEKWLSFLNDSTALYTIILFLYYRLVNLIQSHIKL